MNPKKKIEEKEDEDWEEEKAKIIEQVEEKEQGIESRPAIEISNVKKKMIEPKMIEPYLKKMEK